MLLADYEIVEVVPEDFHRKELIKFLNKDIRYHIIETYEDEIEELYTMHYPHLVTDSVSMSMFYEGKLIENLVIDIISVKSKLKKFKHKATVYARNAYKLLDNYSSSDRKEILDYFYSKGATPYTRLISGFIQDSYRYNEEQRYKLYEKKEKLRKQKLLEEIKKSKIMTKEVTKI